jgi:hypothetical protein
MFFTNMIFIQFIYLETLLNEKLLSTHRHNVVFLIIYEVYIYPQYPKIIKFWLKNRYLPKFINRYLFHKSLMQKW